VLLYLMALSIVDIKAHGNSVTERAPILSALRRAPNQAFPLSLFPCEESGLERLYALRASGRGPRQYGYETLERIAMRDVALRMSERQARPKHDIWRPEGRRRLRARSAMAKAP
jgi:hypothetical protein